MSIKRHLLKMLKRFISVRREKKIKIEAFPEIDLDHPRESWQKIHHELYVQMVSAYECLFDDLIRNGFIEKPFLIIRGFDSCELALASILSASFRRLYRLIYVSWDGDSETSLILARSIFENAVNSLLIKQAPEKAELYLKFGALENKKVLDRFGCYFGIPLDKKDKHQEAQDLVNVVAPLFQNPKGEIRNHWHPVRGLSERSGLVGLKAHYDLGFTRYSDIVHGGSGAMADYTLFEPPGLWKFFTESKDIHIHEAITESSKFMLIIYAAFAHTVGISRYSDTTISAYNILLKHQDYQDCQRKNQWLKDWMERVIKTEGQAAANTGRRPAEKG